MSYFTHLQCEDCALTYSPDVEQHLCTCGGILLAQYDLESMRREVPRSRIESRPWHEGFWRYTDLLPVQDPANRVILGEGTTPIFSLTSFFPDLDIDLWLKDEGLNPTG